MSQHGYQPSFRNQIHSDKTMDLFIETLTGTAFEMTVSPFDTVMSIKSKIQRVEGIPVSHQHLLYNTLELEDASCLIDYSIHDGATLKLVLSMRGGPISTRRLPVGKEIAWKEHLRELVEGRQDDGRDRLPPGARVTVFVFGEGSQMNLVRVIENDDGSYTPLSESWSGSSIRNLFAEEDPEQSNRRLQENSVTMGKMQDLQHKMETLTMQRKPKNSSLEAPSPARPLLSRRVPARPQNSTASDSTQLLELRNEPNVLQLPQLVGCATLPAPCLNSPHSLQSTDPPPPPQRQDYRLSRRESKADPSGRRPGRAGLLLDIKPKRSEALPNHFRDVKKPLVEKDAFGPSVAVEDRDVGSSGRHYRLSQFVVSRETARPQTAEAGWRGPCGLETALGFGRDPFAHAAALDVAVRSPRYGRRSLALPAIESQRGQEKQEAYRPTMSDQPRPDPDDNEPDPEDSKPDSDESKPDLEERSVDLAESKPDSDEGKPDVESKPVSEEGKSEAATSVAKKSVRIRCAECKKRLNITNMYTCRCGQMFCAVHRHCEAHHCTFDYKSHGRRQIQEANPFVGAPKLPKI